MISRVAVGILALALVIGLATGCQPEPSPSPSVPVFANEEDAFAAAEETYRAYVDALNQVDLSDPQTFEAVYAWTTGDFNADERKTFSGMHADGWAVSGASEVTRIDHLDVSDTFAEIEIGTCVDVASVSLVDADGVSQVSPDRPSIQTTLVELISSDSSPTGYLIAEVAGHELEPPCQL